MKIQIEYAAWSNISYKGVWEMEVEDGVWNEASQRERNKMIDDYAEDKILSDIDYRIKE